MAKPRRQPDALSPQTLVAAYSAGMFPMGDSRGDGIGWYCPNPRGLIPLDDRFHISRSLRQTLRRQAFDLRTDTAFVEVMRGCADRSSTWITPPILDAYTQLHRLGLAHSVEAWADGELVGGLYGVSLNGAFFGESMFSRRPDASKACLAALVRRLRSRGFLLLDTQWTTPHLLTFGAFELPHDAYLRLLHEALSSDARWEGPCRGEEGSILQPAACDG